MKEKGKKREDTTRSIKYNIYLIIVVGLLIRIVFALYTNHVATNVKISRFDDIFFMGMNTIIRGAGFGATFYLFYSPHYINYLILNVFDIHYAFLIQFLFKIPVFIADIIIFYALYNIAFLCSKDKRLSLGVAAAYFLNPYVIWMSSIIGHVESLMVASILLSFMYLLKGKMGSGAICLAFSVSLRYLPIFLLPYFLVYLWKKDKSFFPSLSRFLKMFVCSLIVFFSPFILMSIKLYLDAPSSFWMFVDHLVGGSSAVGAAYQAYGISGIQLFMYNFTGFLATLGFWPSLKGFFGMRSFILIYLVVTLVFLKYSRPSIHWMNRYVIIFYSVMMLVFPLTQHHYMIWIFPFVLLEAMVFFGVPRYVPHVLWISNLLIDPFTEGSFLFYSQNTFPSLWPISYGQWVDMGLLNIPLQLGISGVHGLFLLLTIIFCLISTNSRSITKGYSANPPKPMDRNFSNKSDSSKSYKNLVVVLFFSLYCLSETLRFSFNFGSPFYSLIFLIPVALVTVPYSKGFLKQDRLFKTRSLKFGMLLYLAILLTMAVNIMILQLDLPIFLLVQIIVLWSLWFFNRRLRMRRNLQRVSFIFTIIYVFVALVTSKNMILGINAFPFIILWTALQVTTEKKTIMKMEKTATPRKPSLNWRQYKRRALVYVVLSVLACIPLVTATLIGAIPNSRSFDVCNLDHRNLPVTSYSPVQTGNGSLFVGSLDSKDPSWAVFFAPNFAYPLLGQYTKRTLHPYLLIEADPPISTIPPEFNVSRVGWNDDNFTSGYSEIGQGETVIDGEVLDVYANFMEGERKFHLLQKDLPSINSSEYPFVVVRWRSTDHVARFCVFEPSEEGEYKVIVETEAGVIQFPAIDYGGGYSPSWTTTIYELPPNKTITSMDLGVDSGAWGITELGGEHPISGE